MKKPWTVERILCGGAPEAVERLNAFARREAELLEANNRYLERARTAERALEATASPDVEICPVCAEPFRAGDTCASDIDMGTCHAACLEGSPVVDLNSGEPSDGPVTTFPYEPDLGVAQPSLSPAGTVATSPDGREAKESPSPSTASPVVTDAMVEAALDAADYVPNADNRQWMRAALSAALPITAPTAVTPLSEWPLGEAQVIIYDPRGDYFAPRGPHKVIDASLAFFDTAQVGDRLYSKAQVEEILAITSPPARGQVEVKALEWCDEDWGTLAYPDIGEYRIEDQGKNWTDDRYWFSYAGRVIQKYGTFEAGKAAAQAHHDRIILSRILTSPAEPAPATGGE